MSKFEIEETVGTITTIYRGDCYKDLLLLYRGVNQLEELEAVSSEVYSKMDNIEGAAKKAEAIHNEILAGDEVLIDRPNSLAHKQTGIVVGKDNAILGRFLVEIGDHCFIRVPRENLEVLP